MMKNVHHESPVKMTSSDSRFFFLILYTQYLLQATHEIPNLPLISDFQW